MAGIYLKDNSPYYQICYYDNTEENPRRRRKGFSTRILVTPADKLRRLNGVKPAGTPEVKKMVRKFEEGLFERNLLARTGVVLRRGKLLSETLPEFLATKPDLAPATIRLYKISVDHFIKACSDKEITNYKPKDYQKLSDYFINNKFSPTTRAMFSRHLFALWSYFIKEKYIQDNIIIKTRVPKTEPEPIPFDDMQTILNYFEKQNFWQYAFVYFLLLTGFRESSAIAQRRKDIFLTENVMKAINVKAKHREFWFPISEEMADLLKEIEAHTEGNPERLFYVFKSAADNLGFWKRGMNNLLKAEKIKRTYVLKQIRKTFPSWLAASGIHINVLQKLLDHSNIEVTKEHYVKLEAQRMLQDVSKVRFKSIEKTAK